MIYLSEMHKGVTTRHSQRSFDIHEDYFQWMKNLVYGEYPEGKHWDRLLNTLDEIEFTYILNMDGNRAADGIDLRCRYADEVGYPSEYVKKMLDDKPCSVLEMMIALSIRCEEHIMSDPEIGDRTSKWFFDMVKSLRLYSMTDDRFSRIIATERIYNFLDRKYSANGRGGLFTVTNARQDMRDVEIWYQMMWYLDEIIYGRR